jgi:hypothetical protein
VGRSRLESLVLQRQIAWIALGPTVTIGLRNVQVEREPLSGEPLGPSANDNPALKADRLGSWTPGLSKLHSVFAWFDFPVARRARRGRQGRLE